MTGGSQLFDVLERTDPCPAGYSESNFKFLNRVAGPFWDRTRLTAEEWFERMPVAAKMDLRGRFRSRDDHQTASAFWELFLHESLRREGFVLDVHPVVPGSDRRPDFLVRRDDLAFYLEATVVGSPKETVSAGRRRAVLLDALDSVPSPNFFLLSEFHGPPATPLATRALKKVIADWLLTLDPDQVAREGDGMKIDALPSITWEEEGCRVDLRAVPKKADLRGRLGRTVGGHLEPASMVDDITPVRKRLDDKARRYGELDLPLVLAVSVGRMFFHPEDGAQALFGRTVMQVNMATRTAREVRRPDGLLTREGGGRNGGVSAVLVADSIQPWSFASQEPVIWHNPWASTPLGDVLPWASRRVDLSTGELESRASVKRTYEILGVPEGWPGPEDPFPDC